jgi:protein-disulfide isomerase
VRSILVAVIAAAVTVGAQTASHPALQKPAIDKKKLEEYLRHVELWVPQITVEIGDPKPSPVAGLYELPVHVAYGPASKDITYYISRDGRDLLRATVYDLQANPFAEDQKLIHPEGHPSFGPASAILTIAMFSDFECPLCRDEAKTLRENLPSQFPSDVRVVFFDMPLDAIHPWARAAAIAGRCAYGQNHDSFWSYFDWMYEHQGEIKTGNVKDKALEWAKTDKNIDSLKLANCIDTKATEPEVNKSIAEAKALQVDATPTLFLNGRRLVGSTPWQNLETILKLDIEYTKTHGK